MPQLEFDRVRFVAVVGVLAVLSVACTSDGPTRGVDVRSVATDVGLGVVLETDEQPEDSLETREARRAIPLVPPAFEFDVPQFKRVPTSSTGGNCPEAGPFDFPDEESTTNIVRPPQVSALKWALEGKAKSENGSLRDLEDIQQRQIVKVEGLTTPQEAPETKDDPYTFTVEQPFHPTADGSTGIIRTVWLVVATNPAKAAGVVNRTDGQGIYLMEYTSELFTAEGARDTRTFRPEPPIEFADVPFTQGEKLGSGDEVDDNTTIQAGTGDTVGSSGTDPASGVTLTVTGTVERQRHVDACGKKVDSWFVNAKWEWQSGAVVDAWNYDYAIAPQFGGLIVSECWEKPVGDFPDRVCHDDPIPPSLFKQDDPTGTRGAVEGLECQREEQCLKEREEERERQAKAEEEARQKNLKRLETPDLRFEYRMGEVPQWK